MEVNVKEAKTLFYHLLERVADGEEITISSAGVPTARLVPIQRAVAKRQLGIDEGRIWIARDFDRPSAKLEASLAGTRNLGAPRRSVNETTNLLLQVNYAAFSLDSVGRPASTQASNPPRNAQTCR
jgi:prevent-host-death family protein